MYKNAPSRNCEKLKKMIPDPAYRIQTTENLINCSPLKSYLYQKFNDVVKDLGPVAPTSLNFKSYLSLDLRTIQPALV